jgi:hypothetical protein
MLRSIRHLATHRRCPSSPDNHTSPQIGGRDKLPNSCMQWGIRSSLFRIFVVQDFQKFSKSLKPLCRPFRQAPEVGKQLGDFGFLSRQIEAAGMPVHIGECVRLFPNHRFHRRRYFLHLVRAGDCFFCGGLRVFCYFFHIYIRERYWLFSLVGDVPTRRTCSPASGIMSFLIRRQCNGGIHNQQSQKQPTQ